MLRSQLWCWKFTRWPHLPSHGDHNSNRRTPQTLLYFPTKTMHCNEKKLTIKANSWQPTNWILLFLSLLLLLFPPLIIELERFIRNNQSKPKHNKTLFIHSLISFHLFIPFCYCEIHCKILALEIISPAPYWICLRYLSISSNLCLMWFRKTMELWRRFFRFVTHSVLVFTVFEISPCFFFCAALCLFRCSLMVI